MPRRRRPPPYNPLVPTRPRALRRQARRDVRNVTMPLARQINREAAAGEANIQGITEALAAGLGGYQAAQRDIYQRGRDQLSALDAAQAAHLGQTGGGGVEGGETLAGTLRKNLELSGAGGDLANQLATATQGASGAGFVRGGAELGELTQRQAAAEDFAAKLPGLARLAGIQGVQERAAQQRKDLGELQAQMPGQVQQLIAQGRNRNFQIGAANLAYQGDVFGQQQATRRTALQQRGASARTAAQQAGQDRRARARNAETARHNRNMEEIRRRGGDTSAAAARERARHNRATEKIARNKGLSQKKPGKKKTGPRKLEDGPAGGYGPNP